jgi:hypothetical protein
MRVNLVCLRSFFFPSFRASSANGDCAVCRIPESVVFIEKYRKTLSGDWHELVHENMACYVSLFPQMAIAAGVVQNSACSTVH